MFFIMPGYYGTFELRRQSAVRGVCLGWTVPQSELEGEPMTLVRCSGCLSWVDCSAERTGM